MNINLIRMDVLELNYKKNISGQQKLEMQTNVQYSVNVALNAPQCKGEAWLTVCDKNEPHAMELKLHVAGLFGFEPVEITDDVKRQLHTQTFEYLYPYLSAQVACFTSLIGMPKFIIPKLNISQDDVMIINVGNNQ